MQPSRREAMQIAALLAMARLSQYATAQQVPAPKSPAKPARNTNLSLGAAAD